MATMWFKAKQSKKPKSSSEKPVDDYGCCLPK
jgi:hypothetical protein